MLYLTNTLSGKKEIFKPFTTNKATLYVCGITPYDLTHIGHGRCYVVFDLLYRILNSLGYEVSYCRNYTDIDDRLLKKAQERFGDQKRYPEIAQEVINDFQKMMRKLNCRVPTYEPRVTEHMPEIISFISALIEQGYAYQSHGDVYFIIEKFPAYGKLSRQKIEELRAHEAPKEVCLSMTNENKRDPLDFALWKAEKPGQFWQSPWGWGRPGWHIECSALAYRYLGEHLDLHGGGIDIIFPHHENEIAQSEGRFDKQFVQYWVHNGLINIGKEKMSKSLGNTYTLHRLLNEYDPMVVRFYFFLHHFRTPIEFSFEGLKAAQKAYQRLCRIFDNVDATTDNLYELLQKYPSSSLIGQLITILCDDLNTAGMFGIIFDNAAVIQQDKKAAAAIKGIVQNALGLMLELLPEKKVEITPEVQKLIDEREHARKTKDFKKADEIRVQLEAMGIEVQDKKLS